ILILNKWRQSTISRSEVVLIQSEIKARAHQISRRCGVIPENLFDNSMQRSGVGSLIEVNPTTKDPCRNIVWFEGNEAILSPSGLPIGAYEILSHRGTSENLNVSRIQLDCTLEVAHGIMPTVLPAVDVSSPFKNSRVVGQGAGGDRKLVTGVVVVEVAMVKMPSQGKVCVSRIWFQSKSGIYCSIRQLQTA